MSIRLSKDTMDLVVLHSEDARPGKQLAINHGSCPAGEDTRGRLSIKVTDDGCLILAHCFNCGGSGVRSTKLHIKRPRVEIGPIADDPRRDKYNMVVSLYRLATRLDMGVWPLYLFVECTEELEKAHDFGMRQFGNKVFIPRGDESNGFDIRQLDVGAPKWDRVLNPDVDQSSQLLLYNISGSDTAVIVEDPISAMKVALAGYAGVALCGSHLTTDDAYKLKMLFSRFVVWLDNDNETVLREADIAQKRLALFSSHDARRVNTLRDPKYFVLAHIKSIIEDILK